MQIGAFHLYVFEIKIIYPLITYCAYVPLQNHSFFFFATGETFEAEIVMPDF